MTEKGGTPLRVEGAAQRYIGPQRGLNPEFREPIQEPSHRLSRRGHSRVGPEDAALRVKREQLLECKFVDMGVKEELLPRRESRDHRPTTRTNASQTVYVFVQVKASVFEDNPFRLEQFLFLTQA